MSGFRAQNHEPLLIETVLVRTGPVAIGAFRCPVAYPNFHDTGPIAQSIVVFPRNSVWIQHEGARPFLADPTIATIYNRDQRYERFPASPDGDRCEWFGVSDDLAREIASTLDGSAMDAERPFRYPWTPTSGALYLRQRALSRRAREGRLDALEAEEGVIGIVSAVLGAAHAGRPRSRSRRRGAARRHRELADATKLELSRTIAENRSVHDLASSLDTSAYHLCRVFRACTGLTMHEYRSELRVRVALEMLEQPAGSATLASVAHTLGFSSHSHFVQAMRRHTSATPSMARALVTARS